MAGDIEIRSVEGRMAIADWLSVPERLYANDKAYVAPLRIIERQRISSRHNPFFVTGDARFYLAYRDGVPVGRISAQAERNGGAHGADQIGYFGFFDCADDIEAARALVLSAQNWLAAQHMTRMRGPFNLTINQDSGLLVDGFDTSPAILTSHTGSWCGPLLEAAGLVKAMDLFAYRMSPNAPPAELARLSKFARSSGRVRIRRVDMKRFDDEVRLIFDIFNDAWSENWGFVPVREHDIAATVKEMRPIMQGKFGFIAEIDGEPAAMMVVLPDLNRVIQPFGGRLLPFNWARLAREIYADRWKTARVVLLGIRKKHRAGLLAPAVLSLLLAEILELGRTYDLDWVELSWILESNIQMVKLAELSAGPPAKTFRIYEKSFAATS